MKKMKILLFWCASALAACAIQRSGAVLDSPQALALTQTVWMHLNGDWQHPPPDDDSPDYRFAPATLLRFSPAGQFSMIDCWVSEFEGKLAISNGDGQAIHVGSWSPGDEKTFLVQHRLVYEFVRPTGGGKYPGPEKREAALVAEGRRSSDGEGKGSEFVLRLPLALPVP